MRELFSDKKISAVVLSAGKGSRMNSDIPKQYMDLLGYPLIYYTLKAFEESKVDEIVLVVEPGTEKIVRKNIIEKYSFDRVTSIVPGGSERYWSVYNGIKAATGRYVLIHDGARAFVTPDLIERMADSVLISSCIAAVPAKDTIKTGKRGFVEDTLDRSSLYMIQTPQAFERRKLLSAYYDLEGHDDLIRSLTDDSMIMEHAGERVRLIDGEYTNIKVTTREDLLFGEAILRSREK